QDERSVAGMAMALGRDRFQPKTGYAMLVDYAQTKGQPSWMTPERMNADPKMKEIIGQGVFALEENSSQAIEARVSTLPVVFEKDGAKYTQIPIPTSWRAALQIN